MILYLLLLVEMKITFLIGILTWINEFALIKITFFLHIIKILHAIIYTKYDISIDLKKKVYKNLLISKIKLINIFFIKFE